MWKEVSASHITPEIMAKMQIVLSVLSLIMKINVVAATS